MAAYLEHFGLRDLAKKPEDAFRLCSLAMVEGQRVRGYRGDYFRLRMGDAVAVVRTMGNPDTGEEELLGLDTHAVSSCTWDCRVVKDVTPQDADPLSRRLLVRVEGTEDLAVADVVCADVVPTCEHGLRLNMAAFPLRLDYSLDPCTPVVEATEDAVLLQGTVRDVKVGKTYLGMEPLTEFISATVSTSMGDVELCHRPDMVREEQRDFVKVGATVSALCVLSGDAAVGEYAGGIAYGEERDLEVLRRALMTGDVQRLQPILRQDCAVQFLNNRQEGVENALALLAIVTEQLRRAGITSCVPGRLTAGGEGSGHAPGEACLLLGGESGYAFLCLMDCDSVGCIRTLVITNDSRWEFEPIE